MQTLAVLTMLFLPATAVASLFSTPFFVVVATGLKSQHFGLFWAVTVPVTIVVMDLWVAFLRVKNNEWPKFGLGKKNGRNSHD